MTTSQSQLTLFDAPRKPPAPRYPEVPGAKEKGGTSEESAKRIRGDAEILREQCLDALLRRDLTADEVAELLGRSVLSVRPRITELFKAGRIEKTEQRRRNASGHNAVVWHAIE